MNRYEEQDEANGDIVSVTSVTAIESLTRGEIDVQIRTAHAFPRDVIKSVKSAESMACIDEDTAAGCLYALPRSGKKIEGPSVRLAEIMASTWRNLRVASRVIDIDQTHVTAQAVCHDLESNVCISVERKRRITDRHGKRFNDDMITVTANAASSIAFRDSVFKVIPKVFADKVYFAAKRVAIGDAKTLSERRTSAMERLAKMGAFPDRVLAAIGKPSVEAIDLSDLETLFGMCTAIREGSSTVDELFPPVGKDDGRSRTEQLKDKLTKNGAPALPEPPAAPKQEIPITADANGNTVAEPAPEPVVAQTATTDDDKTINAALISNIVKYASGIDEASRNAIYEALGHPQLIEQGMKGAYAKTLTMRQGREISNAMQRGEVPQAV